MTNAALTIKDYFPLIGSAITVSGAGFIAYVATWSLNRSMKQTEFFLKFTERFHNILQSKHKFELSLEEKDATAQLPKISDATARKEARELYRQLFGLMFDEFFAYQRGFLARSAFIEWMRWRNYEYKDDAQGHANFAIGPVPYKTGWAEHSASPVVRSEFSDFLNAIHEIDPAHGSLEEQIEEVVLKYTWLRQRILPRTQRLAYRARYFLVFIALVLLFAIYGAWLW
jgi:hypothetical protein